MYTGNYWCDLCIDILEWWSKHTSLTYAEINLLLFVVGQPLLIVLFFITTMVNGRAKSKKTKRVVMLLSWLVLVVLIIGTIVLVAAPLGDLKAAGRL